MVPIMTKNVLTLIAWLRETRTGSKRVVDAVFEANSENVKFAIKSRKLKYQLNQKGGTGY